MGGGIRQLTGYFPNESTCPLVGLLNSNPHTKCFIGLFNSIPALDKIFSQRISAFSEIEKERGKSCFCSIPVVKEQFMEVRQ